jgi:hypothetical protein
MEDIEDVDNNQPFCKAILVALNKKKVTDNYRPCLSEEILKLPGVKDPAWEKLDLSQHEELAKKIYVLNSVGTVEYFRKEKVMPQMYPTREQQQRSVEGLKKLGAEMFLLRLPPESYGKEVLVTLRYKNDMCGKPLQLEPIQYRGEAQDSAWVNPDLKEIAYGDLDTLGGRDARAARPLMYQGQLYLVRPYGTDDAVEVFMPLPDFKHNLMDKVCNISMTSTNNSKGEQK